MAPLTKLISQKRSKIKWTAEADAAFKKIKAICAEDALLFYPDYSKSFAIHTNSSEYQMGAVISQEGNAIAYWSRRISLAQKKYPTIEQELLAITEVLKEYRGMLLGQRIVIHTDHKNLTYDNTEFSSNRVLRQRLAIEDFGPVIKHIQGEKNIGADTLSRLDFVENDQEVARAVASGIEKKHTEEMYAMIQEECFLGEIVPVDYSTIHQEQLLDEELQNLRHSNKYRA